MNFLLITNSKSVAAYISREDSVSPMIDLEQLGKAERQGHLDAWTSSHSREDVPKLRDAIGASSRLVVRVNPMNPASKDEIDYVINNGADCVMLPMFRTSGEVRKFVELLDGRVVPLFLCETKESLRLIPEIIDLDSKKEVHFGLNDLHLDLGNRFLFEPLANGMLDEPARLLSKADIPFGIGGVARIGEGQVTPESIMVEHARLGSTRAILSRTFHRNARTVDQLKDTMDFSLEVERLKEVYRGAKLLSAEQLEQKRLVFIESVERARFTLDTGR